jgi:hypothetical protein
MKKLFVVIICSMFALSAFAQTPASECEAKAVDKNGKPLAGAAKASFIKKCEKSESSDKAAACEAKAVSKEGKPLSGAAKSSSVKKCLTAN